MRRRWKLSLTLWCLVTLCVALANAQSVTRLEYYFDLDQGIGHGRIVPVNPDSVINFTFNADLTGLSAGIHQIGIRAQSNNGNWSLQTPVYNRFLLWSDNSTASDTVGKTIVGYECFIDIDPGLGYGTYFAQLNPATTCSQMIMMPLNQISNGVHTITIRAKCNDGKWSLGSQGTARFMVWTDTTSISSNLTGNIIGFETFIDDDPGAGHGFYVAASSPGHATDGQFVVPLNGVANGIHQIYIRAKGDCGIWSYSVPVASSFLVWSDTSSYPLPIGTITRCEYYIDSDPGYGNGISIPFIPSQQPNIHLIAPLTGLPLGPHVAYFRVQDSHGRWSIRDQLSFSVVLDNNPMLDRHIAPLYLDSPITNLTIANLDTIFSDPDLPYGDHLTYSCSVIPSFGQGTSVTPSIVGTDLQISSSSFGYSTVIVNATDSYDSVAHDTIIVDIRPPSTVAPTAAGYMYRTSTNASGPAYNWVDIRSSGTKLSLSGDEAFSSFSLGSFIFPFYGSEYNGNIAVSTNGLITLGPTTISTAVNVNFPTATLPTATLALFWDDAAIVPNSTEGIWYKDMLDGRFIIEYYAHNVYFPTSTILAEAILYRNGTIRYQYNTTIGADKFSASIGIQNNMLPGGYLQFGSNTMPGESNFAIQFDPTLPWCKITPASIDFGLVPINGNSTRAFQIRNFSAVPLHITGMTTPANVTPSTSSVTIAAGDSTSYNVTWQPPASGALLSSLSIESDAISGTTSSMLIGTAISSVLTNNEVFPTVGVVNGNFQFTVNYTSYVTGTAPTQVLLNLNSTSYPMTLQSGSLPGTEVWSTSVTLSNAANYSYYFYASYSSGNIRLPASGSFFGPSVLPPQTGGPYTGNYLFAGNYSSSGPVYHWIDISTTGSAIWLNGDEALGTISNSGFQMPFYGSTVGDTLTFSSNGFIVFGPSVWQAYNNTNLPAASASRPCVLFPLWDDLTMISTSNDRVMTQRLLDGRFVISYWARRIGDLNNQIRFQVILNNSGDILFQYDTIPSPTVFNATIGIQGATTGTSFIQYGSNSFQPISKTALLFTYPKPTISMNPATVSFGTVMVGNQVTRSTMVRNGGLAPLRISNLFFPPTFSANWTSFPISIAAGDSVALQLTWTPNSNTTLIDQSGRCIIISNVINTPVDTVFLTGSSWVPQAVIETSVSVLDFGSVQVNLSAQRSLILFNSGNYPYTITQISAPPTVTHNCNTLPVTIAPGDSLAMQITWSPISGSALSGSLIISSSATNNPVDSISLAGICWVPLPQIEASVISISFGSVQVSTTGHQGLYVRNPGTATLSITQLILPSGISSNWNTFPITILSGDSLSLQLNWTPTLITSIVGDLTIISNASNAMTVSIHVFGNSWAVATTPTNLTLTVVGNNLVLNWSAATGTVSGYNIYRSTTGYFNPPGTVALIGTVSDGSITQFTIPNALPSTAFYYRVTAFNTFTATCANSNELGTTIHEQSEKNLDRRNSFDLLK